MYLENTKSYISMGQPICSEREPLGLMPSNHQCQSTDRNTKH